MATTDVTKIASGLGSSITPEKFPVYGTTEEQQQEYQDAIKKQIDALEARYAQPNWFKVAAGFAKPQLGGFLASLGSASEALGENVEQQRAMAIPLAEMRAKLAQSQALMGQNVDVSKAIREWRSKPENSGKMPPASLLAEWASKAPELPAVQSLLAQQKVGIEQQGQALQTLKGMYDSGEISKKEYGQRLKDLQSIGALPKESFGTSNVDPTNVSTVNTHEGAPVIANASTEKGTQPISFGTPSKLLDNLRVVESGKDDYAVNPETKAMGPYQFLPETVQMLHKQGIKFNPFDEKEARSAADKYLKQLHEQSGGDWNKAIANYGGFKTKDPTEYINKVTKGVDFTKPESKTTNVPEPINHEESGLSGPQAIEQAGKQAEKHLAFDASRLESIATLDQSALNRQAAMIGRSAKILTDNNVKNALGKLSTHEPGLMKAVGNLIQKGVDVSLAGGDVASFHTRISADVDDFVRNLTTDPKTARKVRELMMNIMTEARSEVRAAKADIGGTIRVSEFQNILGNIPQSSDPYQLLQKYIGLRSAENTLNQNLYNEWQQYSNTGQHLSKPAGAFFLRPNVNKAYKEHRKNLTDAHDIGD